MQDTQSQDEELRAEENLRKLRDDAHAKRDAFETNLEALRLRTIERRLVSNENYLDTVAKGIIKFIWWHLAGIVSLSAAFIIHMLWGNHV